MTVNAGGRGRRRSSAAAAEADPGTPTGARPRGASQPVEPTPIPTPTASKTSLAALPAYTRAQLASAPAEPPATPPVPAEEPARLDVADRRGYAAPPPPQRLSLVPPVGHLAIGEIDQTLFDCPVCRRPLALGTRRCPGCRTRLVRGVVLGKVVTFAIIGVLLGTVIGLGGGLVMGAFLGRGADGGVIVQPSAAPDGSPVAGTGASAIPAPTATATPAATPTPPDTIPSVARSALVQVIATNGRLAADEAQLRAALVAKPFDATEVARILRAVSADSVFGLQLADRVVSWTAGGTVPADLQTFYGDIHDAAAGVLMNSVRNPDAYRTGARTVAELLAGSVAIDDAVTNAAAAAGVSLPEPSPAP